jgi:hypothetical protein
MTPQTLNASNALMTRRKWRWPTFVRVVLAGPGAIIISLLFVACMPVWFPKGAAGIDHIALPVIILPGVWAVLFFYAVLDRSLIRVALVAAGLVVLNLGLLIWHFATPAS